MSLQVAAHQTEGYLINTEVYQGPLDLLLELIEKAELDITRVALAQVTDQYLAYLHQLQEQNAAEVSAFLIIAARLLQIKSAALLPRPSIEANTIEEEDPGEALARQLLLYKRFKELAAGLAERDVHNLRSYLRISPAPKTGIPVRLDLSGITLSDLLAAARDVFRKDARLPALSQVINMPRITIRERISAIVDTMRHIQLTSFRALLPERSNRVETVVTFLAMLELIKRHIIEATQPTIFGDIELRPLELLEQPQEEINIEFDE